MKIIEDISEECKKCLACLRECPVNAIRIENGIASIIEEKCIHCGQCVLACTQKAKVVRNDVGLVEKYLDKGQVIAILSTEYAAALHPFDLSKIEQALLNLGFSAVEESILGEELTARQMNKYLNEAKEFPVIRSTCPVIVSYIQKYHSELIANIAPIVSPMVAQSKICRSIYPDASIVYIGECVAQKAEAEQFIDQGGPDVVLTYWELLNLIEKNQINLEKLYTRGYGISASISREFSFEGGFPRELFKASKEFTKSIIVLRGKEDLIRFKEFYTKDFTKAVLLDIMFCQGCIDGPVIRNKGSLSSRKEIIEEYAKYRSFDGNVMSVNQISDYLPNINLDRKIFSLPLPQEYLTSPPSTEIKLVLNELGFLEKEEELNCTACGFETCWELAESVVKGTAEISMCFPFHQRKADVISRELHEVSGQDTLTTLANYARYQEILNNEFNRAKRYGSPLSLIILDIDHFKLINDTYGHVKGDKVLKLIAEILRQNLRDADIPVRQGGDEFAIILPEINKTEAFAVAEKIRNKVEETSFYLSPNDVVDVTISLGVGSFEDSMDDKIDLVEVTDEAMYKAKKSGRNKTMLTSSNQ